MAEIPVKECTPEKITWFSSTLLYLVAFLPMITNSGVFWDDWEFYIFSSPAEKENIIEIFRQTGRVWAGYFLYALSEIGESFIFFRIVIALLYFAAAVLLNWILREIKEIGKTERLFVVLIFLLLPANYGRIIFLNTAFAASYFLFFLAFFLLTKYDLTKSHIYHAASLILFYFSFFTDSLLVFYYVTVGAYLLYTALPRPFKLTHSLLTLARRFDFMILPIVFWTIKKLFINTYGVSKGYNAFSFSFSSLSYAILSTVQDTNFFDILFQCITMFSHVSPVAGILLLLVFFIVCSIVYQRASGALSLLPDHRLDLFFAAYGVLLLFAALLPYHAVGKIPALYDFESRHQLLLPLGFGFILIYGIKLLYHYLKLPQGAMLMTFIFLVVCFTLVNGWTYLEYQVDWHKQQALMENFKNSNIIKSNSTFVFSDNTKELNAARRSVPFYEYNGMMRAAFNSDDRFGEDVIAYSNKSHFIAYHSILDLKNPRMNMRGYVLNHPAILTNPQYVPEYVVIIDHGPHKLTKLAVLALLYNKIFNRSNYDYLLSKSIQLRYQKI